MTLIKKYMPLSIMIFILYLLSIYWKYIVSALSALLSAASPVILGLIMAYVVNIVMIRFEKLYEKIFRERFQSSKRIVCIILSYLSVVLVISVIIAIVVPQVIDSAKTLVQNTYSALQPYVKRLEKYPQLKSYAKTFMNLLKPSGSVSDDRIKELIQPLFTGNSSILTNVTSVLSSLASALSTFFFGFIFSLYLLGGKEKLQRQLNHVIRTYLPKAHDPIYHVAKVFDESFSSYIISKVTDGLILGILTTLGCVVLRLPNALMAGPIIGITALIPIVGAYIGALVVGLLMFIVKPVYALYFVIFYIILQQIDDNLIYPRIIGSSMGLPPIWILGAITVFGGVFGFIGMLIGVPIVGGFYKLLQEDVHRRDKQKAE